MKKFSKEFFEKQYNIYIQNHQSLVDKFIFFEEFEKDLNFVSKKLNLPFNLFETFKNIETKHYIRPQESKMSIIDAESSEIITSNASNILKMHGYKIINSSRIN